MEGVLKCAARLHPQGFCSADLGEAVEMGNLHKSPGDAVAVGPGAALWNLWFMTSSCLQIFACPLIPVTHKNLWELKLNMKKNRALGTGGDDSACKELAGQAFEDLNSTPSTQVRKPGVVTQL